MGFDFERMTLAFEAIAREHAKAGLQLPSTALFVDAMCEVNKLFETLGTAFAFVKRDIDKKVGVVNNYSTRDAPNFSYLHTAINYEIRHGKTEGVHMDSMPNCSRTVLRLMWALAFADSLLDGLRQAFDASSDVSYDNRTLRWAVSRAYEHTLAEHHSWTIRRAVKGACIVLPTKENFMVRVGVEIDRTDELLNRLAVCMSPLVTRMYSFYQSNGLLSLQ